MCCHHLLVGVVINYVTMEKKNTTSWTTFVTHAEMWSFFGAAKWPLENVLRRWRSKSSFIWKVKPLLFPQHAVFVHVLRCGVAKLLCFGQFRLNAFFPYLAISSLMCVAVQSGRPLAVILSFDKEERHKNSKPKTRIRRQEMCYGHS